MSALKPDRDKGVPSIELERMQGVISIIGGLDVELAEKILRSVDEDGQPNSNGRSSEIDQARAELYAELAYNDVTTNPAAASANSFRSLSYGLSSRMTTVIAQLNSRDPAAAQQLYSQAIARMPADYSRNTLEFESALGRYIFDKFGKWGFSDSIRKSFLLSLAERVANAALVEAERPSRCRIASYAGIFVPSMDEYLPDRSIVFRQQMDTCIPFVSRTFQELTKAQNKFEKLTTVDEFVQAAQESHDDELKVRYWREALSILETRKDFSEMISLLDSTKGDDFKKLGPIGWDSWRSSASYQLAWTAVQTNDMAGFYKALEKTPKVLRPRVRLRLAAKISPKSDLSLYLDNLDELQKDLTALDLSSREIALAYKKLTDLYLTARPTECEAMFRQAVKYINKADDENPDLSVDKDWAPMLDVISMDAQLLEIDEQSISSSFNNLSSRRSRVRLKLGLLESSLKKYVDARKALEEANKKKPAPLKTPSGQ